MGFLYYVKKENGTFKNKEDAIRARKKAEEELFEPILEKAGKNIKIRKQE